ncbi:TetR/AcrR family transcriptional regulator [Natronospirillum operosum]|uniref:TetR/AcrR family transcriptional regulator n=1 Tax=Natronospirillum operosum TaxID=2759953 RepID=A0A4Z0W8Z8_9GAMM|nr:TetR family transcriptional regulator [Natronospirillum operosum]TGG90245.1 TetR/AcrR family transcriptional regulator [Natronospirillum operosum]
MSTESTSNRKDQLARAAFDLIAEVGIEGLRTRDVAARVGINISTLHYYFPTKRDLIEGVAHLLGDIFYQQHAEQPAESMSSLERLRQEFRDARANIEQRPDVMIVLYELVLLSRRHDVIVQMLEPLLAAWRGGIAEFLAEGVRDGTFRSDLDPDAGADFLVSTIWGASALFSTDVTAVERICAEIERSFTGIDYPVSDDT